MTLSRFGGYSLLILLIFLLPACSNPEQKKEKHYKRALEYIKLDNDKSAILELKNAIQIDAKFADARYQLALLQLKDGQPRAAFGQLQRTVSLDPKNLDAGVKLAEFYLLSRDKEESRKVVEQVLTNDSNYTDALALLANIELIEGNFDKAEEAVDQAIANDKESDKLYNIKGRILATQNKLDESEVMFNKAIQLNPDNFANQQTLLRFFQQKKDLSAFQNQLDAMISKFPENDQLQIMLADYYQRLKEPAKAEQALLKAIEIKKDSIQFRLMLAKFYQKQNQLNKAEELLNGAGAEFPENIQLKVALAGLLFEVKKFDAAKEQMDNILASNPANGGGNLIKARFQLKEGDNDGALETLTPLTTDYPKWADPYYYSAITYLKLRKIDLAQQNIAMALQNDVSNDRYHAVSAQINLIQGNSDDATKEAAIALKINPRNFIAVKILVKSLVQAKKFEEAINLIEGIEKQVAGDAELIGSLSIAYLGMDNKEKAIESLARLLELVPNSSRTLALFTALTTNNDVEKSIELVKKQINKSNAASHYLLLGELYIKNKQLDEALDSFLQAKELNLNNPAPYLLRARLLRQIGKTELAANEYKALLLIKPDSIPGNMGLATIFDGQGESQKAKELYARILQLKPDFAAAANNLAWLIASEEGGDLGEALRLAMQAKQSFPDQANIADTLGWVHYKRNSYSLAIFQFTEALEKRAGDPVILYHLALAEYANNEPGKAVESIKKALDGGAEFKERAEAEALLADWQSKINQETK